MHTCKVCHTTGEHKVYHPREMMFGLREEFEYFECSNCGCLQIVDIPNDIERHYPSNYYSFAPADTSIFKGSKGAKNRFKYKAAAFRNTFTQKLFWFINGSRRYEMFSWIRLNESSRILDIGCGNGFKFLYPLAEIGVKTTIGSDPFIQEDLSYSNGVKVFKKDIANMKGEFDLIVYNHSFEHLPDPQRHLKEIKRLLAKDGNCMIRIPTASSHAWKKFGIDWFQLDAPRHFFLHTTESMNILAEEAELKVDRIIYDSTFKQFTESIKYTKDIPLRTPRKMDFKSKMIYKWNKYRYGKVAETLNAMNQGDQAAFILRHK